MSFLPIPPADDLSDEARSEREQLIASHGEISNLRAALLSHVPSFRAYLEWYTLRDELTQVVGERSVILLSYAISDENGCTACALYFQRILEESGEDLDPAGERECLLVDFGRQVARDQHGVPDDMYAALAGQFSAAQRVVLVAYAGLMVATNLVNTVGRVPLDAELRRRTHAEAELAMDSLETGAE